jgi:hypothetical protein
MKAFPVQGLWLSKWLSNSPFSNSPENSRSNLKTSGAFIFYYHLVNVHCTWQEFYFVICSANIYLTSTGIGCSRRTIKSKYNIVNWSLFYMHGLVLFYLKMLSCIWNIPKSNLLFKSGIINLPLSEIRLSLAVDRMNHERLPRHCKYCVTIGPDSARGRERGRSRKSPGFKTTTFVNISRRAAKLGINVNFCYSFLWQTWSNPFLMW